MVEGSSRNWVYDDKKSQVHIPTKLKKLKADELIFGKFQHGGGGISLITDFTTYLGLKI